MTDSRNDYCAGRARFRYQVFKILLLLIISICIFFNVTDLGPPGVLGVWGEWLFIFRGLGSTGNYFRGAREQAHNFGDIESLAKKQKKIRKSLHFVGLIK